MWFESGIIGAYKKPSLTLSSLHSYIKDSTTIASKLDWIDKETTSGTFLFLQCVNIA